VLQQSELFSQKLPQAHAFETQSSCISTHRRYAESATISEPRRRGHICSAAGSLAPLKWYFNNFGGSGATPF